MVMVIFGACQLAAPPLFCLLGGGGSPPPLFLARGGGVGLPPPLGLARGSPLMSSHVLVWPGDGSWAPALDATGVCGPPPVPAAALVEEVLAGPSFCGRRGGLFLFLLPIIKRNRNLVLNPKTKVYEVQSQFQF